MEAYVILALTCEGRKEVLSLTVGDRVTEKWSPKYPNAMKRWIDNWDVAVPIFKFSENVRKIIYTTNSIESLNSCYRRLNRQGSFLRGNCPAKSALE